LAEIRFALARALWPQRTSRKRALGLAHQARKGYAGVSQAPAVRETERIDAWLGERDTPLPSR
jgi:hypothetical protein